MSTEVAQFEFTDEVKRRAGWWGSPYYEIRIATELILTLCCVGMVIVAFAILRATDKTSYRDLTDNWQARPIVDIVPVPVGNSRCPLGSSVINEIQGGSCVCYEDTHGFHSGPVVCSKAALANDCTSARFSHGIVPHSWRGVSFCFSRSDQAAASWRPNGDDRKKAPSRPYPDTSGVCPSGYRRCGQRSQYEDGGVCIPEETLCPITNIQIADKHNIPRVIDGWEPAGALQNGSFQLYVRREGAGELPVVDIALAFKETTELELNTHHGPVQANGPCLANRDAVASLIADPEHPWTYEALLPRACGRRDVRYQQFDEIPLQEYYLQQLQDQDPSCAAYSVLPLTDPAYTVARDPDYANSGVVCQSSGQQSCFLDGATASTCNASDAICDVAVNQNTCGAYTHAIRSAFADTTVSLGLYFRREIPWSQSCPVHRAQVSHLHHTFNANVVYTMGWGRLFTLWLGLLYNCVAVVGHVYYKPGVGYRLLAPFEEYYVIDNIGWRFPSMVCYLCAWFQYSAFYRALSAVHSGDCTDPFTLSTFELTTGLTKFAYLLFFLCIIEVLLWVVAWQRCIHIIHSTVRADALVAARNALTAPEVSSAASASGHGSSQAAPPVAASTEVRVPEVVPSAPEQSTAAAPAHVPVSAPATRTTAHILGRSPRRQLRSATGTTSHAHAYQSLQGEDSEDADVDCDGSDSGDVELRTVVASMV